MIVVDSSTRQFTIPATDQIFGVEADAGSEVKYFQAPRYVGNNLDLAGSFLRINYRNPNGDKDSYLIQDVTVDGDKILFSWKLTPRVTAYKGEVKFVLCATGQDQNTAWHTTLGSGKVLEGLEPDTSHVEEETSDVVAQLVVMVEAQTAAVENMGAEWVRNVQSEGTDQIIAVQTAGEESKTAAMAEIEAKGKNVRDSIPEDYTALSEAVATLAPGIICEAEGTAITLNDSSSQRLQGMRIFGKSTQDGVPSPDAPAKIVSVESPVVKVCGKNLLKNTAVSKNAYGVTITINEDGSVTLNGTATQQIVYQIREKQYYPNCVLSGCPTGGGWETYSLLAAYYNEKGYVTEAREVGDGLALPNNYKVIVSLLVNPGVNVSGVTFYPMIRHNSVEDATFEPYRGGEIETSNILPGIPVASGGNYTDATGQQWICDEVDLGRGVYVRRVERLVLTGAEVYGDYISSSGAVTVSVSHKNGSPIVCSHTKHGIGVAWANSTSMQFNISVFGVSTLDEFKDFLGIENGNGTPVEAAYVMPTPIENPLSETEIAAYRALHTNKPNTTIINDSGAHMAVEYVADTKLYIDNLVRRI